MRRVPKAVFMVVNLKSHKCLKTFYDYEQAFFYCRKIMHKGIKSVLIYIDVEEGEVLKRTIFSRGGKDE